MKHILVTEDDRALNDGIRLSLSGADYSVSQAFCIEEARAAGKADLVILDINLPDGSGIDLCREIKEKYGTPVIFLTVNDLESDIVTGLESGGDDYITKPFSLAVLRARVNAVLRRNEPGVKSGGIELDFENMRFYKNGMELELSKTEQRLLRLLSQNPGVTMQRERLIDRIWSDGAEFVDTNALSVAVKRLRDKIEDDQQKPELIKTVYGIGYVWNGK